MLHGFLKTPWKAMNKSLRISAGIYDTRGNCSRGKPKNDSCRKGAPPGGAQRNGPRPWVTVIESSEAEQVFMVWHECRFQLRRTVSHSVL